MTGVLVGILGTIVAGLALARALHPTARPLVLMGEGFLIGCGWAYFALLASSLAGLAWSPGLAAALMAAPAALFLVPARAREARARRPAGALSAVADAGTLATAAGYALFATIAPMWEWDFWAIWGLKARVFLERGGVDWAFLQRGENLFSNPDYPLLLPLYYDLLSLPGGEWEPRWIGLVFPLFGLSLLLVARGDLEDDLGSAGGAAIGTLALTAFAFSAWIGLAEGPLIAYAGSGLILIRRGLIDGDRESWRAGAVLVGLGAAAKNEGGALVIAVALGALVHLGKRWREAIRLWPAAALAAIWPLLRAARHLRSYYLSSETAGGNLLMRLKEPGELVRALVDFPASRALFWTAFVAALLVARRHLVRERFLLVAIAAQLASYLLAYASTSHPLRWQVQYSWVRLVEQLGFPAMFLAIVLLFPMIIRQRPREAADST